MAASDFFEDLNEYKKKVGLIHETASLISKEIVTQKDNKVSKKVKTKKSQAKKLRQNKSKVKKDHRQTLQKGKKRKNWWRTTVIRKAIEN